MATILIVEDEKNTREGIRATLAEWGGQAIRLETAANGKEALARLDSEDLDPVDAIVTDIRMPLMSGLEMLEAIRQRQLDIPAVVLSAYSDFRYAQEAIHLGVVEYVLKPVDPALLLAAIERALDCKTPAKLGDPKLAQSLASDEVVDRARSVWNPGIRKAVDYLFQNYRREVGARELADLVHLNQSYFCTLFKNETGCTFGDYLTRVRVSKAKELLLTTDERIYEIAEAIGYTTARYFAKVFHDSVGMTPREYRAKYRS